MRLVAKRGQMLDKENIARIVDDRLTSLRNEMGLPRSLNRHLQRKKLLIVKNLEGDPSYWLVVFLYKGRILGFFRLDLEGELVAFGTFGRGELLTDFPPTSYVSDVTAEKEIRKSFTEKFKEISSPVLVHDGPPDRIAWLSRAETEDGKRKLLFWTFGASYSRLEGEEPESNLI